MSKPNSYHFSNTTELKKFILTYDSPEDIILSRTKNLDLREHPITFKELTPLETKEFKLKIANRTIKKKDYKLFETNRRLSLRRQKGIRLFWKIERQRIINNELTTRIWSTSQKRRILNYNKPMYNGKPIYGHHTYSVRNYPHLADKAEIIYPTTFKEHLYGWHGGDFKKSKPGCPIKSLKEF